jgi:hypothetical protein
VSRKLRFRSPEEVSATSYVSFSASSSWFGFAQTPSIVPSASVPGKSRPEVLEQFTQGHVCGSVQSVSDSDDILSIVLRTKHPCSNGRVCLA